jgi:site-specific DNA-methyltransferase (adenine-specific)
MLSLDSIYLTGSSEKDRQTEDFYPTPPYATQKKYNIIYADPPWSYADKASSGKRGASYKYDVMNINDIKNLPIHNITDDNCILFLWVTFPMIQEGLDVIKSWGFTYKTVAFVWVKKNKKNQETNFWGMGNWTRSNSEVCLLAIKGKPKRISAKVHSVIETFKTETLESPIEGHSKKPDIVRNKIIELCDDIPRIELFARQKADGWSSWGNEIESDIHI